MKTTSSVKALTTKVAAPLALTTLLTVCTAFAQTSAINPNSVTPFGDKANTVLVDLINAGLSSESGCVAALIDSTHAITSLPCIPHQTVNSAKTFRVVTRNGINREHEVKKIYAMNEAELALIELSSPIESQNIPVAAPTQAIKAWLALPESSTNGTHFLALNDIRIEKNRLYYQLPKGKIPAQGTPIINAEGKLIGIHAGNKNSLAYGVEVSIALPFFEADKKNQCGTAPGIKCVDWQTFFTANETQEAKFTWISSDEYQASTKLTSPEFAEKRSADINGPKIHVTMPPMGGETSAPVDVLISFESAKDAEIVPTSFKVKYGMFGIDITDRLLQHAELGKNTLTAKHADIPKGNHKLDMEVMDNKGRLGLLTFNFTVN